MNRRPGAPIWARGGAECPGSSVLSRSSPRSFPGEPTFPGTETSVWAEEEWKEGGAEGTGNEANWSQPFNKHSSGTYFVLHHDT